MEHRSHREPGKQPESGWRSLLDFSDCFHRARHPNEVQRPGRFCSLISFHFRRPEICISAAEAFGIFTNGQFGRLAGGQSDNGADLASYKRDESRNCRCADRWIDCYTTVALTPVPTVALKVLLTAALDEMMTCRCCGVWAALVRSADGNHRLHR